MEELFKLNELVICELMDVVIFEAGEMTVVELDAGDGVTVMVTVTNCCDLVLPL